MSERLCVCGGGGQGNTGGCGLGWAFEVFLGYVLNTCAGNVSVMCIVMSGMSLHLA